MAVFGWSWREQTSAGCDTLPSSKRKVHLTSIAVLTAAVKSVSWLSTALVSEFVVVVPQEIFAPKLEILMIPPYELSGTAPSVLVHTPSHAASPAD